MGNSTRLRFRVVTLAAAAAAVVALATACSQAAPPKPKPHPAAAPISTPATAPPVGPHGGVDLNVLVVTDGTGAVEAIRQQLTTEGLPSTVIDLRDSSRPAITRDFLARRLPDGTRGGNFDGIVLPSAAPQALSAAEQADLAWYESKFGVRQVDAYSPPMPALGMSSPPAYSGPLTADAGVTPAGVRAGFGYLNGSFPFSGGAAGLAPFGYLAQPLPGGGATPLVTARIPHSSGSATLVWRYDSAGRQQLGIGFGYSYGQAQFHYLAHGIVDWLTRGVNLGDWRNYLDIAYDDMFLGDAQWSTVGHCTPGVTTCPQGHADDRDDPDEAGRRDLRRAVGAAAPLHDRVPVQRRGLGPVRAARGRRAAGGHPAGGQGLLLGQPHLDPRVLRLPAELQGGALAVRAVGRAHRVGGRRRPDQQPGREELRLGQARTGSPPSPGCWPAASTRGCCCCPSSRWTTPTWSPR